MDELMSEASCGELPEESHSIGNPLTEFKALHTAIHQVALSHDEVDALRCAALQLATDLQARLDAVMPPEFGTETPFHALQGMDELRLVTDLVPREEALCLALACRKFRDAVFARCPRDCGGLRLKLSVGAHVGSISRLHWAVDTLRMPIDMACSCAAGKGKLDVLQEVRRLGGPWDEGTSQAAAQGGHLHVLQWLRAGPMKARCPWDERTCEAAARGGHIDVLRWMRQRKCKWDEGTCFAAATKGHLAVLQWARKNACPWDPDLLEEALECGQFDTFEWAWNNGLAEEYEESVHPICNAVRARTARSDIA